MDEAREVDSVSTDDEDDVTFEVDLSDVLVEAGAALYEASEEFDSARPYEPLDEQTRDAYEAAASVVLEAALPEVIQQVVDQLTDDDDDAESTDDIDEDDTFDL